MKTRAQQGQETRERIVDAAVAAFSEKGFRGASTRDIARRADTTQGLITYHFHSKDELWRAAADRLFGMLTSSLGERPAAFSSEDPREQAREAIRAYVRFVAKHPELFRFLSDEGKNSEERMEWLVDTHLKPRFEEFFRSGMGRVGEFDRELIPHAYYTMAGAGSLIFAVAPECRRLTGLDPLTEQAIETHAEFLARLMIP